MTEHNKRYVDLVPPQSHWPGDFKTEAQNLKAILKEQCLAIHHIGSTAISDIYAKPIIDLMPVVENIEIVDQSQAKFEALGYISMGEYGITGRRFFWKSLEKRTHHVHVYSKNSSEIAKHLGFRDFLRAHADYALAYSVLKQCYAKEFYDDIENYVNAKSSFIQMVDYLAGVPSIRQLLAKDKIEVVAYQEYWPKLAAAEISAITKIVKSLEFVRIEHIGSTAVPQLASKPIIDLLIVLPTLKTAAQWIKPLESLGYCFWDQNPDRNHLRFFKGMPPYGEARTHHIHLMAEDHPEVNRRIYFRNILRQNEEARKAYENLKLQLAVQYAEDREAYTEAKSQFISDLLK